MIDWSHEPIMLAECVEGLDIKPDEVYVDATLGSGGHSEAIAGRLCGGKLIAIDRDGDAIERSKERLSPYSGKITYVRDNFSNLKEILDGLGIDEVSGILLDLGVSSPQLDEAERGFSYMSDAPLDMRMDRGGVLTAREIVNSREEEELTRILRDYGEERYARLIASAIVRRREKSAIETTAELVEIIKAAMPAKALREKGHPAKRSFQAIRIAVNDELSSISGALKAAEEKLKPGGRLCVISFHSLEDRLVKSFIASRERGCTCPRDFPECVCGFKRTLQSVTRKPVVPGADEQMRNPRSRSAKLRIAGKI